MTNDELLERWKKVLDYTDDDTPPLNEWERLYRATLMENCELAYLKYCQEGGLPSPAALNLMICAIRRNGITPISPFD